jgi:hypothetical protein
MRTSIVGLYRLLIRQTVVAYGVTQDTKVALVRLTASVTPLSGAQQC